MTWDILSTHFLNYPPLGGGSVADIEALEIHNPKGNTQRSLCTPGQTWTAGVAFNRVPSPESNKENPRQSYQTR